MEAIYDPSPIEARVRERWAAARSVCAIRSNVADMSLEHLRRCVMRDVSARYQRMQGLHRAPLEAEPCAVDWPVAEDPPRDGEWNPAPIFDAYGADTVRLFLLSNSPPDQRLECTESALQGARRFLRKLWRLIYRHTYGGPTQALDRRALDDEARAMRRRTHETIAKVTDHIGRRRTSHTAIAGIMALVNAVIEFEQMDEAGRAVTQEALETVVLILSPIAPYLTQALWQGLGHEDTLMDAPWPPIDGAALAREEVEWVVQVNGKLRGRIVLPRAADRARVEGFARANVNVARNIQGKQISKVIVVPGKLVNLVVTG
ncbi:MAG: class I tRNA ligase family protein [Pseudomonadota bacterium]